MWSCFPFLKHDCRGQLAEEIQKSTDHLGTIDELESYASQFKITGDTGLKLGYLDVFLEKFGVRTSTLSD